MASQFSQPIFDSKAGAFRTAAAGAVAVRIIGIVIAILIIGREVVRA